MVNQPTPDNSCHKLREYLFKQHRWFCRLRNQTNVAPFHEKPCRVYSAPADFYSKNGFCAVEARKQNKASNSTRGILRASGLIPEPCGW